MAAASGGSTNAAGFPMPGGFGAMGGGFPAMGAPAMGAFGAPAAMPMGGAGTQVVLDCPAGLVGKIIGKGGEVIRDLQLRSGCAIQIDQNFPEGMPRKVTVQGSYQGVEMARHLIQGLLAAGPVGLMGVVPAVQAAGPQTVQVVDCPQAVVGRVIGKGGETIKLLQAQSGCKIQIDQNFPEGHPRKITVEGSEAQVRHAVGLIDLKINENGPGAAADPGAPQTIIDCPKSVVGKVIGRGGETINQLQIRSGARIQIDQQVPEGHPCKVSISGTPEVIETATRLVNEIIMGGGAFPPLGHLLGRNAHAFFASLCLKRRPSLHLSWWSFVAAG